MKRLLRFFLKVVIIVVLDIIILCLFWFSALQWFWNDLSLSLQIGSLLFLGVIMFFCDKFVLDTSKVEKNNAINKP